MINNLLNISKSEEQERRIVTAQEISKLSDSIQKLLKKTSFSHNLIKDNTLKQLKSDILKTIKLNHEINQNKQEEMTFPLRTNKNLESLLGAESLIIMHFDAIISKKVWDYFPLNSNTETILGYYNSLDIHGTSTLNFLQVALFSIISTLLNNKKEEIFSYLHNQEIYDINKSPNIQGTILPKRLQSKLTFEIEEWVYFHNNGEDVPSELICFNTGYAFGGSAGDIKYKNKKFRSEDCFTSLIKWLNSEHLFDFQQLQDVSTLDVEKYYDAYYLDKTSNFYNIFEKMFKPIGNTLNNVEKGDIFAYRTYDILNSPSKSDYKYSLNEKGHIGVITNIDKTLGYFDTLSYSRNIMEKEGLGYYKESIYNPYKKYMFLRPVS